MKNKNETMNIIEEKKPEYAEDAFKGVVPEFSFSVNGTQVVIRVKAIVGAENYEVYQSETPRGKYAKVVSTATPVIEFYVPDGKSYYYKVRAFHGIGDDKATTDYSKPQYIDLVTERIQINLCVDCFDKVLDTIVSMCKINPVVDGDWMEHCLKKNDGVIYISRRLGSGGDYKDTPRKRIFIDMDGVLCEYRPAASVDDMMQNGYFASLKPRKEMLDAVKGLIKFGKYDVYVLSAVIAECAEQSKFEKNEWLDRYIPEIGSSHRIFTLCGTNKADAVESITLTDILLDDHSPNLEAWINAGGKAIKVLNECNGMNGTFVTGPRIKIDSTTTLLRALTNI